MAVIREIRAREVLDSRGDPTVEVEVFCSDNSVGRAIVPAGASTGSAEAHELRDGESERYFGRGVLMAVRNVREHIAPSLVGLDPTDLLFVDARLADLDDTPRKTRLGANAILGTSLAVAQAGAAVEGEQLYRFINRWWQSFLPGARSQTQPRIPLPMINLISGGLHADSKVDYQDYLIVPLGAASFAEALQWTVRVARRLSKLLTDAGYEGRLVSDEGSYGPRLKNNREAAEFIVRAIEAAGLRPGDDVALSIDLAATHFFDGKHYRLSATGDVRLSSDEMIEQVESLVREFPIYSIEDPLAEEDWEGWQRLTERLGSEVRLLGDDLFATHEDRLRRGVASHVANAVLVKPNQVGTLTETLGTMRLAHQSGYTRIVSARSGETEDTTIADLAVGTAARLIKIGSIQRSERLAKYNRLLRIEEDLGPEAINW